MNLPKAPVSAAVAKQQNRLGLLRQLVVATAATVATLLVLAWAMCDSAGICAKFVQPRREASGVFNTRFVGFRHTVQSIAITWGYEELADPAVNAANLVPKHFAVITN